MEVMRNQKPQNNFLQKIRKICNEKIILIFDECTSGYRENMGGIHLKFKVNRYSNIWQSTRSGYAINAIIGKKYRKRLKILLSVVLLG